MMIENNTIIIATDYEDTLRELIKKVLKRRTAGKVNTQILEVKYTELNEETGEETPVMKTCLDAGTSHFIYRFFRDTDSSGKFYRYTLDGIYENHNTAVKHPLYANLLKDFREKFFVELEKEAQNV